MTPRLEQRLSDWQAIESAPKDGSDVLVFCDDTREMFVAFWNKKHKAWQYALWHDGTIVACAPAFWMPLPPPPKEPNNDRD